MWLCRREESRRLLFQPLHFRMTCPVMKNNIIRSLIGIMRWRHDGCHSCQKYEANIAVLQAHICPWIRVKQIGGPQFRYHCFEGSRDKRAGLAASPKQHSRLVYTAISNRWSPAFAGDQRFRPSSNSAFFSTFFFQDNFLYLYYYQMPTSHTPN